MMPRRLLCVIVLSAAAQAQQAPDASEQASVMEAIRASARAYAKNLPNFICTQITRRELTLANREGLASTHETLGNRTNHMEAGASASVPQSADTYEEQLTYFEKHEEYQLQKVNGKKQKAGQQRPPGMTSTGEFGTTLDAIFDPATHSQFEWKKWDTLRGAPVYVFSFRVDKARSQAQLEVPSSRVVVGYHGLIYADRETKTVLRLTTEAEVPSDFPLQDVTHLLDYGKVEIAGQQFWLPLHGEMQTRMSEDFMKTGREGGHSRQVFLTNRVDFREYRKYTADSQLKP